MVEIKISFNKWSKEKILNGKKRATCRKRPQAKLGDTFILDGRKFRIFNVQQIYLGDVADYHYRDEGCESPEEFVRVWVSIYHEWNAMQVVYIHEFVEVEA